MAILLKTASVRVSSIQIMQVRVQNKGKSVWKSRYDGDISGGVPAPSGERGREPPFFFFLLDLLPRWEKGFPYDPWPPWRGRGESLSEIGSVSLSLSVSAFLPVPDSGLSPFLIFPEIHNSDWAEILTRFLSRY